MKVALVNTCLYASALTFCECLAFYTRTDGPKVTHHRKCSLFCNVIKNVFNMNFVYPRTLKHNCNRSLKFRRKSKQNPLQ